jgi:hypothetical protein
MDLFAAANARLAERLRAADPDNLTADQALAVLRALRELA